MKVLRIKDWNQHYENAQSRKIRGRLDWFPVPTKHDGKGFRRLMRQENGAALYGCWILIAAVAAKSLVRGYLIDSDGPLSAEDISLKTDAPVETVESALRFLIESVGWIEVIEIESMAELIADHEHATSTLPAQWEHSGSTSADGGATGQDRTGTTSSCSGPGTGPGSGNAPDGHPGQAGSGNSRRGSSRGTSRGTGTSSGPRRGSVFAGVTEDTLRDTGQMREWFLRQAQAAKPVLAPNASGWELALAFAEIALGGSNPPAWFASLAGKRQIDKITPGIRERALSRAREFSTAVRLAPQERESAENAGENGSTDCTQVNGATRDEVN